MKVSSNNRVLALLTVAIPLAVLAIGWLIVGELNAGVIVTAAMTATLCQIVMTLRSDLQTVIDVEYEVYQSAAKKRQERLLEWQERQDRIQTAARLHDSVINTLCAASMMTPGTREQQLQDRCRHDLAALEEFVAESAADDSTTVDGDLWLAELSQCVAEHSTKLGLQTTIQTNTTDSEGIPFSFDLDKHRQDAIDLAVRESLTNIAKHSASTAALVTVDHDEQGLKITVTDQGSGWRAHGQISLAEFSLFSLGSDVQVAIANNLAGGLRVEIRPEQDQANKPSAIRLAVKDYIELPLFRTINFWLTGLSIIVMVMFFGSFSWLWWLLAALLVVSSSMAMTNLYSLSRKIPEPLLYTVATSAGILVASPVLLDQPQLGQWWVLVPATILLITASWTGVGIRCAWVTLAAIMLGASILAAQQLRSGAATGQLAWVPWAILAGIVITGSGLVLGSRWVRGVIDRSTARTETELARAAAEEDLAVLHARRIDVRQRLVGRCMAVADPMLRSIADGQVDLGQASVQQEVRYIERLLRSAISLGREQDQLSSLLFDLLWSAYDVDVEVKIASYRSELMRTPANVEQLRRELEALVGSLPAGAVVSVSTYDTDQGAQLLVVSQSPESENQDVHQFNLGAAR